METRNVVFELTRKRTFKRVVKLYIKANDGKFKQRNIDFTTENIVRPDQRSGAARRKAAQFITNDPIVINALLSDTGYGITFIQKGDDEGKLKKASYNVTEKDAKLMALRLQCDNAKLVYDDTTSFEVLKEQLLLHLEGLSGVKTEESAPSQIAHNKVDVKSNIQKGAEDARELFIEKYNQEVPDSVYNDLSFFDALSNDPKFDALAYIALKEEEEDKEAPEVIEPSEKESLHAEYQKVIGTKVANNKSNDLAWIKGQIAAATK